MPKIPEYALSKEKLDTGGAVSIGGAPLLSGQAALNLNAGAFTVGGPSVRAQPMTLKGPEEIPAADPGTVNALGQTMAESILKYNDRIENLEAEDAFIRARQEVNNLKWGAEEGDSGIDGLQGHDMIKAHDAARQNFSAVYQKYLDGMSSNSAKQKFIAKSTATYNSDLTWLAKKKNQEEIAYDNQITFANTKELEREALTPNGAEEIMVSENGLPSRYDETSMRHKDPAKREQFQSGMGQMIYWNFVNKDPVNGHETAAAYFQKYSGKFPPSRMQWIENQILRQRQVAGEAAAARMQEAVQQNKANLERMSPTILGNALIQGETDAFFEHLKRIDVAFADEPLKAREVRVESMQQALLGVANLTPGDAHAKKAAVDAAIQDLSKFAAENPEAGFGIKEINEVSEFVEDEVYGRIKDAQDDLENGISTRYDGLMAEVETISDLDDVEAFLEADQSTPPTLKLEIGEKIDKKRKKMQGYVDAKATEVHEYNMSRFHDALVENNGMLTRDIGLQVREAVANNLVPEDFLGTLTKQSEKIQAQLSNNENKEVFGEIKNIAGVIAIADFQNVDGDVTKPSHPQHAQYVAKKGQVSGQLQREFVEWRSKTDTDTSSYTWLEEVGKRPKVQNAEKGFWRRGVEGSMVEPGTKVMDSPVVRGLGTGAPSLVSKWLYKKTEGEPFVPPTVNGKTEEIEETIRPGRNINLREMPPEATVIREGNKQTMADLAGFPPSLEGVVEGFSDEERVAAKYLMGENYQGYIRQNKSERLRLAREAINTKQFQAWKRQNIWTD